MKRLKPFAPLNADRTVKSAASLFSEHEKINSLCEDLLARAETGDWKLCDAAWDEFARDLENHMQYEEREIFPRFLAEHPERVEVLAELQKEHTSFRHDIAILGVAVQLQEVRESHIRSIVSRLERHAQRENQELYPKLEELGPPDKSDLTAR